MNFKKGKKPKPTYKYIGQKSERRLPDMSITQNEEGKCALTVAGVHVGDYDTWSEAIDSYEKYMWDNGYMRG